MSNEQVLNADMSKLSIKIESGGDDDDENLLKAMDKMWNKELDYYVKCSITWLMMKKFLQENPITIHQLVRDDGKGNERTKEYVYDGLDEDNHCCLLSSEALHDVVKSVFNEEKDSELDLHHTLTLFVDGVKRQCSQNHTVTNSNEQVRKSGLKRKRFITSLLSLEMKKLKKDNEKDEEMRK